MLNTCRTAGHTNLFRQAWVITHMVQYLCAHENSKTRTQKNNSKSTVDHYFELEPSVAFALRCSSLKRIVSKTITFRSVNESSDTEQAFDCCRIVPDEHLYNAHGTIFVRTWKPKNKNTKNNSKSTVDHYYELETSVAFALRCSSLKRIVSKTHAKLHICTSVSFK